MSTRKVHMMMPGTSMPICGAVKHRSKLRGTMNWAEVTCRPCYYERERVRGRLRERTT